jgi:hypothetical protein
MRESAFRYAWWLTGDAEAAGELARAGLAASDIAVWEINEAFAAMVLSCLHDLPAAVGKVDVERVNPNGGAIAIGHPLGASAPRVIVDACRELQRRGGGYGVAAACIGVGQTPFTKTAEAGSYLELLRGLRRRFGMALLLITHDLGVVANLCRRVLHINLPRWVTMV